MFGKWWCGGVDSRALIMSMKGDTIDWQGQTCKPTSSSSGPGKAPADLAAQVDARSSIELVRVQERLTTLRAQFEPNLTLRRRAGVTCATTPFPTPQLHLTVDPPASCSHFDLDSLSLVATVEPSFPAASDASTPVPRQCSVAVARSCTCALMRTSTAACSLHAAMAQQLCNDVDPGWRCRLTAAGPVRDDGSGAHQRSAAAVLHSALATVFARIETDLPELLTLVPAALERYETVNAHGSSERRVKFVSTNDGESDVAASGAPESVQQR